MAFQFPKFEFVVFVGLYVGILNSTYGAKLVLLCPWILALYFPRMFYLKPSCLELARQALAQARASPRPGLYSRAGAAAVAVAALLALILHCLGISIISHLISLVPWQRDAAAFAVLFIVICVAAPFLVDDAAASVLASRTAAADIEINPKKLARLNNTGLRAALEAAGLSTEGDKKALVERLVAARRAALIENLSVGLRVVTLNGAYGSIESLPEQGERGGWVKVRLDGEEEAVNLQLGDFTPVTAPVASLVASLLPLLKDGTVAVCAAALLYLYLHCLGSYIGVPPTSHVHIPPKSKIYISNFASSEHFRGTALFVVISAVIIAIFYCLYRYYYCRILPYKLPRRDVQRFRRAIGDDVEKYLNPPKTTHELLELHDLLDLEEILDGISFESLKVCDYGALQSLGVPARQGRAQRLYDAIQEISQGPTHFSDSLARFQETGEVPHELRTLEMIPGGGAVKDILTNDERRTFKDITGIDANHYTAPSLLHPPPLHWLHNTALARLDDYFGVFQSEDHARALLQLPFSRHRVALLRARRDEHRVALLSELRFIVRREDEIDIEPLTPAEVTELAILEEELPGLERQATARGLAEKGYVRLVPTEERPETWTEEDWEGYYRTQEFLQKPRSEQIEDLKDIVAKLTSCACELGWAAAILALWALFEELFERGHYADADRAFERLLLALVRVNFWYSREHFLCEAPADAVKAAVSSMTTGAVEAARTGEGIKVNLEEVQQRLGLSFRKTQC